MNATGKPKGIYLRCCVCDNGTRGRQWWNRDKGFGICKPCADEWERRDGKEDLERSCGERGKHFDIEDEGNRVS